MHEYDIPKSKVIPHRCVKNTSCCGDLFRAFGGGAGKSCVAQQTGLHGWMGSMGIPSSGTPEVAIGATMSYVEALVDHSLRGHHLADEDGSQEHAVPSSLALINKASPPPSATALRIARALESDLRRYDRRNTDDVTEFDTVAIGDGFDLSTLPENMEAAATVIDETFGREELAGFDFAEFEDFINQLGIEHFRPIEFLYLGASNQAGPCKGKNQLPAKPLWPNLSKTAQMLDLIRKELGAPIRILSAYRNQSYNSCISGAGGSLHMRFNAIDWRCSSGTVVEWRAAARKLRERNDRFSGGIGFYRNSQFIHIDTRGVNADW
jgi:N-acetylmuramoyl-L-alanine amidase